MLFLLAGCSTDKTPEYMRAVEQNKKIDIGSLYKEKLNSKGLDYEMYLLEKGRLAQLYGNYEISKASFNEEEELVKSRELYDDTLPAANFTAGSILVNDNMIPYRARLFELEMLYLYQCYNYLALGDLEGALVEIRLADFLLNEAENARQNVNFEEENYRSSEADVLRKLSDNRDGIKKGTVKSELLIGNADKDTDFAIDSADTSQLAADAMGTIQKASDDSFEKMGDILAKSKSSVLNPYVLYVSGVVHEINGEFDDAYISYKKSLDLMPSNPYFQRETIRLAIKLNKENDFDQLKTSFPELWKQMEFDSTQTESNGRLVVLYEDGWVPVKKQIFITLGAFAIAYPVYDFGWVDPNPLLISGKFGHVVGQTSPACYMGALAVRALQEEAKWRIIRQTARATIKAAAFAAGVTSTAVGGYRNNNALLITGIGIMVAAAAYNDLTEKADLRCWMTLPSDVQIMSTDIPEGEYCLAFTPQDFKIGFEDTVSIYAGKITIILVNRVGERLIYKCLWPAKSNSQSHR